MGWNSFEIVTAPARSDSAGIILLWIARAFSCSSSLSFSSGCSSSGGALVFIRRSDGRALHRKGKIGCRKQSNRAHEIQGKNGDVVPLRNLPSAPLELRLGPRRNPFMRSLVGLLVGAALLFAVYQFSLKKMPSTDEGTAATQAISLTGVRSDLLQIAQAERLYIAANGQCASLGELISSNSLSMTRTERDGYSYE